MTHRFLPKKQPLMNGGNKKILKTQKGVTITRKDIILIASNQDGGAHVDPQLDEEYADFSKSESMGWFFSRGENEPVPPESQPVAASIRQIGHEILITLKIEFSDLFV